MNEYELTFSSKQGGGTAKARVMAASEFNARRLLEGQYGGDNVTITSGQRVPEPRATERRPWGRR